MNSSKQLVLLVILAALGLAVSGGSDQPSHLKLRQDLEHDPETLVVRFVTDNPTAKVVWLLHPDAEATYYETERGHTKIHLSASPPRRTVSGYEVTFHRVVTRSGTAEPQQKQVVTFPFGKAIKVRLFDYKDIEGAYGSKDTEIQ